MEAATIWFKSLAGLLFWIVSCVALIVFAIGLYAGAKFFAKVDFKKFSVDLKNLKIEAEKAE